MDNSDPDEEDITKSEEVFDKSEEVFVKSEEVFVKSERDVFNEDVFACAKSLLDATKFDDANVSHDVELKINPPKFWKNR